MGSVGSYTLKASEVNKEGHLIPRHCCCITEDFSGYVSFEALVRNTARQVAKVLIRYFLTFGFPYTIKTGRDTNLIARSIEYVNSELGIHHKVCTACSSRLLGGNERAHGTLFDRIISMCADRPELWYEFLPHGAFAVDHCPCRTRRQTPAALYGSTTRCADPSRWRWFHRRPASQTASNTCTVICV